jgi:hypothetical protein
MLGLFMYLNFSQVGGYHMYLYYPVILIGISVALLFNPIKIFYFRTRMWLLYSLVSSRSISSSTANDYSGDCYLLVSILSNGETSTSATCFAP